MLFEKNVRIRNFFWSVLSYIQTKYKDLLYIPIQFEYGKICLDKKCLDTFHNSKLTEEALESNTKFLQSLPQKDQEKVKDKESKKKSIWTVRVINGCYVYCFPLK